MTLPIGTPRNDDPVKRLPARWTRGPLALGAGCLSLALALSAAPLAAASSPGAVPVEAAKIAPPDPDAIHPVDYSFEQIRSFSGGLAAVKMQGKWGYVDKTGKVVIPFLYDQTTRFEGNWASVRKDGAWGIIDKAGTSVSMDRPLASLSRFSEGLAAAQAKSGGKWGYVDWTGSFVIQPQFDRADDFSQELAAVAIGATWFYVTPSGALALVTPHYRSYSFTADGLALVQEKRDGRYGYIRRNGSWAIPPAYAEARPFSQGLAPVRVGDGWGYLTTSGTMAIPARFSDAFPFDGGLALVANGLSSFFFVDPTGKQVHESPFVRAEGYSDGVAIVGDGAETWYVDEAGVRLPIGQIRWRPTESGTSDTCADNQESVSVDYVNGFAFFQIFNQTNVTWTTNATEILSQYKFKLRPGNTGMNVSPGLPGGIDSGSGAKGGVYAFLYSWPSLITGSPVPDSGQYALFELRLNSSSTPGYTITLSVDDVFKAPPPPEKHPWWDYLKYAKEAITALWAMVSPESEFLEAASGFIDLINATSDIAGGVVDGAECDNDNSKTPTPDILKTYLSVSYTEQVSPFSTVALQPLTGVPCGGDSYTVADNFYVFSLNTVKSASMPATIRLTITPYAEYMAQNAYGKLQAFRSGDYPGSTGPGLTTGYFPCIYAIALQDYTDPKNNSPCQAPAAFPSFDYLTKGSSFTSADALLWWQFANTLSTSASASPGSNTPLPAIANWLGKFGGFCKTLPAVCPKGQMTVAAPLPPYVADAGNGSQCSFPITLNNALGAVGATDLPSGWSENPGNCSPAVLPPPASCTFALIVPAGQKGTANLTDGVTTIPISASCTTTSMAVTPLSFSGASYLGSCPFNVSVSSPHGPVLVNPGSFVTSNPCTGPMDKCSISLGIPSGTTAQPIFLYDGKTTQTVTATCNDIPMAVSPPFFNGASYPGSCPFNLNVSSPHGQVIVTPESFVTSNPCTGPMEKCNISLGIPSGTTAKPITLNDGKTTQTVTATCNDSPMSLGEHGTAFVCDGGGPCIFDVIVFSPHAAVTVTPDIYVASNGCNSLASSCHITMGVPWAHTTATISLSDGRTTLAPISLINNTPSSLLQLVSTTFIEKTQSLPCSIDLEVLYAAGTVHVDPSEFVTSSTCVGAQTCDIFMAVPPGVANQVFTLSDNQFKARATVTCAVCPGGIFLPNGNEYFVNRAGPYVFNVPVSCASPPITATVDYHAVSVDVTDCATKSPCILVVTGSSNPDTVHLTDNSGAKLDFAVAVSQ